MKIELKSRSQIFFKLWLEFSVAGKATEDFNVCKSGGERKPTKNLTLLLHGRVSIFYLLQLRFKTFQTWCFTGWWPYRWRGSSDHYASLLICLILNPAEVDSFSIKCCLERTKNEPGVGPFFEKIRFKAVVMIKFSACSSSTLIIWFWIPQKPTTFIQKCCWKTRK